MLMYVGLVKYIHGHRMEHEWPTPATLKMVEWYDKHERLEWTPELITIFEESKRQK